MAGTWNAKNKVRAGAYVNVVGNGTVSTSSNVGVLLLISDQNLGWGANGVTTLNAGSNFVKLLGTSIDDVKLLAVKEALKEAETVKLVAVNTGAKATVSDASLPWDLTAAFGGTKGNNITVTVEPNASDTSRATVTTVFGSEQVDQQDVTFENRASFTGNDYITASANSKFTGTAFVTTSKTLAGGTDSALSNDAIATAMTDALKNEDYEVASTGGIDDSSTLHQLLVTVIKDVRDNDGRKVRGVVPDIGAVNYEGVSVVKNGYVLNDGTQIAPTVAAARFAGLSANADEVTSLTFANINDAKAADPKLDNEETINALKAGKVVFTTRRGGNVVVEKDINSLTAFSAKKPSQFSKNRVMRVLDTVAQYCEDTFENTFIGAVTNNAAGRDLFKANIASYLSNLQSEGAIQNFDATADIAVSAGSDKDTLIVDVAINPTDSMEKLYMTITVS